MRDNRLGRNGRAPAGRLVGAAEPIDTSGFRQPEWMYDGSCADGRRWDNQAAEDWFEPIGSTAANRAQATCTLCPVRERCAAYALDNEIEFGIWGAVNQAQRHALIKERNPGYRKRRLVAAKRRKKAA